MTHRNQFVGLEGAFGTIKAGRHDTADLDGLQVHREIPVPRRDQWRTGLPADPLDDWYESLWSVGLDRALGEETRLLGFVTSGDIGGTGERNRYVGNGVEHDF